MLILKFHFLSKLIWSKYQLTINFGIVPLESITNMCSINKITVNLCLNLLKH